jgi:hypothetical protein
VEASAILGGTADGDTSETLSRKISTKTEETKKATVSSFMPPRYAFSVQEKHDHDSLNTEGRIGCNVYLVTSWRGA